MLTNVQPERISRARMKQIIPELQLTDFNTFYVAPTNKFSNRWKNKLYANGCQLNDKHLGFSGACCEFLPCFFYLFARTTLATGNEFAVDDSWYSARPVQLQESCWHFLEHVDLCDLSFPQRRRDLWVDVLILMNARK